jgi:hypothetical protein
MNGKQRLADFETRPTALMQRLADLGCLDPEMEADILDRVTTRVEGRATVDRVRAIIAEVLFERQFDPERAGLGLLEEEWRAIFG